MYTTIKTLHASNEIHHANPFSVQKGIIGKGTFGLVVKAVDVRHSPFTCPEVAIKILTRGEFVSFLLDAYMVVTLKFRGFSTQIRSYKTYVKREVVHQGSLKHPLIVRVKEVCSICTSARMTLRQLIIKDVRFIAMQVFLTSKYVGIVQEYVAGGDLHKYLRTMYVQIALKLHAIEKCASITVLSMLQASAPFK